MNKQNNARTSKTVYPFMQKNGLQERQSIEQREHRFLSTRELGTLLGVTRQTIRNWIKRGEVRAFHIGQNLKIPTEEALRIITSYGLPVPDGLSHGDASASKNVASSLTQQEDPSSEEPEANSSSVLPGQEFWRTGKR